MLWFAAFFGLLFLIRVILDPRTMRAGVYLMAALTFVMGEVFVRFLVATSDASWRAYGLLAMLGLAVLFVIVLAMMLILNGVTMLTREGRRLTNMVSLLVGLVFLAEIVWAVVTLFIGSFVMLSWTLALFVPTAYVSFGFLAYVVYSWLYQTGTRLFGRPVEAVVVLGSGLVNGEVPPLLASRLNRGKAVLRRSLSKGSDPVIVVSGGKGSDETRSEAAAMAEYLVRSEVSPRRIVLEDRSRNTMENIANTKDLLETCGVSGRIAVVTNNFHAFRSALLMRGAKMKGYVIGAPTASYYWPSAAIREFVAIIRDHPWFTIIVLAVTWVPIVVWAVLETVNPA